MESRSERACLAASIILTCLYFVILAFFQLEDIPIQTSFLAQRDAVRATHALDHPLPLDRLIAVSTGNGTYPSLAMLDGWSVPESSGIWSDAKIARADVAIPETIGTAATLTIKIHVMLDRRGQQTLQLYSNGLLLGNWTFRTQDATLRVLIPHNAQASGHLLKLVFVIGHPISPPNSTDPRTLGVDLSALELSIDK